MEQEEIRNIQRKNGKIIVRAMMELEVATFEAIVGKICEDYNIFRDKELVESAVKGFLRSGYYSGFLSVNDDGISFDINHVIQEKIAKQFEPSAAGKTLKNAQQCRITKKNPKTKRAYCPKKRND